ncbi:hypothetical protein MSIBF_A2890005 [groundwater metagenome]|uniref:Uncharacterized protein n=1 Tax=groundwater metagenome TaxID=717931 RepID=A0A098EBM1_9ZZZZ
MSFNINKFKKNFFQTSEELDVLLDGKVKLNLSKYYLGKFMAIFININL